MPVEKNATETTPGPWPITRPVEKNAAKKIITHEEILRLHKIIARDVMDQGTAGRYRTIAVRIGRYLPPPPADVPELPKTEKESTKTIREMLARHTEHTQCAMCHIHFDGLGLTMEGFDAIGRARTKDLAGRPVQTVGPLPGGKSVDGLGGLIDYVESQRLDDFERNLCRKSLGYALGRSVVLSDEPLLQEMQKALHEKRRFSVLFETIVLSPQFRNQRGRDYAVSSP